MSTPILGRRALGRATLARQGLLARTDRTVPALVEHLVGMQAQAPDAPYVGLWSRIDGFDPAALAGPLQTRSLVRTPLMRATVHLVTARDCLWLRPLVQVVFERDFAGHGFARRLHGADVGEVLAAGRALIAERPLTRAALAPLLAPRWPEAEPDALAYAISYLLPTVQVPPRGVWGERGPAAITPAATWLGTEIAGAWPVEDLVRRYLGAFGPASVRDAQVWCGLRRLREVFDRLRDELTTFRTENGTELFDLPDAPRPGEDVQAPPRFLPEYDNVLLSHADRTRIIPDGRRVPLPPGNGARAGTLLDDGEYRADWVITRDRERAILEIRPFTPLHDEEAAVAEGHRLLAFAAADAPARDVRVAAALS